MINGTSSGIEPITFDLVKDINVRRCSSDPAIERISIEQCQVLKRKYQRMQEMPGDTKKYDAPQGERGEKLTPYQGKKRCFGMYECTGCDHSWMSANSWANTRQRCLVCLASIYPGKQFPLKKRRKKHTSSQGHCEHLCEKCEALGHSCLKERPKHQTSGQT